MSRFFLNFKLWLVILILIAGVTVMKLTVRDVPIISEAEKISKDAIAPVEGGVMKVSRVFNDFISGIVSFGEIKSENKELKNKVASLETEVTKLKDFEYKNIDLRRKLQFKEANTGKLDLVAATVVARDPNNWLSRMTIDRGSDDGLQKNMPVVTQEGLVGKIIKVSKHNAEVILILDSTGDGVGAMSQVTGTYGVIEGIDDTNYVRMIHLPRDAVIRENQTLVTSGLGGIYPKDIPIGRVIKLQPESNGILIYAMVKPFVDFDRLEEVFVIKKVTDEVGGPLKGGR